MAANVMDPSILAIGCGDGQIRIWKTLSSKSMIDYQSIYQKLARTEISSLAWHPERVSDVLFVDIIYHRLQSDTDKWCPLLVDKF